ncbi:OLC1v1035456C1 [Oldenlandia corymbosa var. corymbosa]|uniref:OLC1v1035456C1 n=1 Tax=Oldenlandia corymbosa var. corymbosa TaxID=529605 RepID=A0AAV1CWD4_OLDCO|nr:OLC1v1035456C1 [Oldenlandia corymbosa var. corymbosa]
MLQGQIFSQQQTSYSWALGLSYLNLSHNSLTHIPQLPSQSLAFLDLSSNNFSGGLLMPPNEISVYLASYNKFTGEISRSMCNLSSLVLLDLSNNYLGGDVPQCLANLSTFFSILDLHSNSFLGILPSSFPIGCRLTSLNLRDNQLEGRIPRSLSNCSMLQVLDLGNNFLDGMFPWWLGTLQNLQVLSLRANHLYGSLGIPNSGSFFPALRILDLSGNKFSGVLSPNLFAQLNSMKIINHIITRMLDNGTFLYYQSSSVLVVTKGMEIDVYHVLSIFTTIDLSNNKFHGFIPDVIGNLIALQGLNLSHNGLEVRFH